MHMGTAKWYYAAGSAWVPFDDQSQLQIESLWRTSNAAWIYINAFRAKAYVNGPALYVTCNGHNYPIARK
ncbi:hypothetical protein BC940DRAFT_302426 [Gongronella butleri]|nr:hypothetical protein BC940DRAFT_302426 [Gongronella butleri]